MPYRECPRCEVGEKHFRVFADGDGDPSVPGGTRSWVDAECDEETCECELTDDEWEALRTKAIEWEYE